MRKTMESSSRGGARSSRAGAKKPATSPVDPRIRRTRIVLRDALLALIREREFAAITVQDVTERAQINRSTFYLHYHDKDDLVRQTMEDMLAELVEHGQHIRPCDERMQRALAEWFGHVATHAELYHALLGRRGTRAYAVQMRRYLEKQLVRRLKQRAGASTSVAPVALLARFLASGYLGALEWWIEQRPPHSAQEMAMWISVLMISPPSLADVAPRA
jgi:AcrR family transcriptional regulator